MKTSIKLLASAFLLGLTVSVTSPVLATDDHTTNKANKAFAAVIFPAADASKLWLCLEKYQLENKIRLELTNERGEILFDEVLSGKNSNSKRTAFRQQFNMSQLNDGKYTFRISAGSQTQEYTFKLSTPSAEDTQPTRLIAIK